MTITTKEIIRAVRNKVTANPDFIYPVKRAEGNVVMLNSCKYLPDEEQPGCLFGQVFIDLFGEDFMREDEQDVNVQDWIVRHYDEDADEDDLEWCRRVQQWQDQGYSWSKAVFNADEKEDV